MSVSKAFVSVLGAALLAIGAAVTAEAATIIPVSAVASSAYGGYPGADAIDTGPGAAGSDWASGSQGVGSYLNVDLGAVYDLDDAFVTDRVTSGGGNHNLVLGMWDFTTQFSFQAYSDAGFTQTLGNALVFNHVAPVNPAQASDFLTVAALDGVQARYLQYKVLATNGANPGLSDLHFSGELAGGNGVPEPTAWILMITGFGAAGAMLRRRRAVLARI